MTMSEQHIKMAHDEHNGSLSVEGEINRLMQTYELNREQAEYVLERKNAPLVPRHAMERLTREEYDAFLKELSNSGEEVFTLGSSSKENKLDDEEQQNT